MSNALKKSKKCNSHCTTPPVKVGERGVSQVGNDVFHSQLSQLQCTGVLTSRGDTPSGPAALLDLSNLSGPHTWAAVMFGGGGGVSLVLVSRGGERIESEAWAA